MTQKSPFEIKKPLEYVAVFYVKHLGFFQRDLIKSYHIVILFIQDTNTQENKTLFNIPKFL